MGFDLNATTLTANAGLEVTFSGSLAQKLVNTGNVRRYLPGQPLFRAGAAGTAAWMAYGASATWIPFTGVYTTTAINVGTCYNTANGRFTAPIDGNYFFSACAYSYNPSAVWYVHGMFWVNGSSSARRPSTLGGQHRLLMHGCTAGYAGDNECVEVIPLIAGDYVQFYCNPNPAGCQLMPQYGHFEGYLLN